LFDQFEPMGVSKKEWGHVTFNTVHHEVELVFADLMHKSSKQCASIELFIAHLASVIVNCVQCGVQGGFCVLN
jgi:hypothetical protein